MTSSEELIVESKSRLSILVIEDTPEYAANALEELRDKQGHSVTVATTLEEVADAIKDGKFDFILSDVHFPKKEGMEPEANVSDILELSYHLDVPVCFVTRADHHGLLDKVDEGYISIRAVTLGDIMQTKLDLSRTGGVLPEKELFRKMKFTGGQSIKEDTKTSEIWERALTIARNSTAQSDPVGNSIRKVRGTIPGIDFKAEKGVPRITIRKKLSV
jgi:CheY-like chemotaxis protein